MTALRTSGLTKAFGSFVANGGIDLAIAKGARHAIIGPNGAGKTTLVNVLTGVTAPTSGSIFLEEHEITHQPQFRRVKLGLARTYQINTLFPALTALETVLLSICERKGLGKDWRSSLNSRKDEIDEATDVLAILRLQDRMHDVVSSLPYGKQRLLEIALGLTLGAKVLLLDEPAAGIPTHESASVFSILGKLPSDVTIVFIEHDMNIVFRFASRVTVLVNGKVLTEGTPSEIAADERVRRIYLGDVSHD